jgi:FKBP-type peptidyl-prolyl cis-trans isomerase 2
MKKGDFIRIDFVGRVSLTGEVFDLTVEKTAREENIFTEGHKYKPILVILGNGMIIKGVELELEKMKVGDEREFEVKPEDAFGKRDQKLIKIISLNKFKNEKLNPAPGAFVTINGTNAKIVSVSGGRVMVDFNHPLSGKSLKYKVKIIEEIKDTLQKANLFFEHYGISNETTFKEGVLTAKFDKKPDKILEDFLKKTIMQWIKELKEVKFEGKEFKK